MALIGTVIVGVLLETVTETEVEVVVLPAASRATTLRTCVPFATEVVSHVSAYGAVKSSLPRLAPFSMNCTPATPTLSLAVAVTLAVVPESVAPAVGVVSETVGAVVSGGGASGAQVVATIVPVRALGSTSTYPHSKSRRHLLPI